MNEPVKLMSAVEAYYEAEDLRLRAVIADAARRLDRAELLSRDEMAAEVLGAAAQLRKALEFDR